MALTDKLTAIANAIRAKTGGTATMTLAEMPTEIASIQTGITPSGSITMSEERSYDVTEFATGIVDMSATRANLAEAVTAKGVDTLPTSSFDTIATNIGLIEGGGGESDWDLPIGAEKATFTLNSDMTSNFSIVNPFGAVKDNLFFIKKTLPVPTICPSGIMFGYGVHGQTAINLDNGYNRVGASTIEKTTQGGSSEKSIINGLSLSGYIAIYSQTAEEITFRADTSYRLWKAGSYLLVGWNDV